MAAKDPPEVLERFHSALELVDRIVHSVLRTIGSGVDPEDLRSHGREGLLEAARRYDPDRQIPFVAFASFRVRGAVLDGVRALSPTPRRTYTRIKALEAAARTSEGAIEDLSAGAPPGSGAAEAEQALAQHLAGMATAMALGLVAGPEPHAVDRDAPDPEEQAGRAELLALVERELEVLPAEEQALVRRHYLEGEPFESVARDLGLSRSWASRLHTRAVARLTQRLRRNIE